MKTNTVITSFIVALFIQFSAFGQKIITQEMHGKSISLVEMESTHSVKETKAALDSYFNSMGVKGKKVRHGITAYYSGLKPSEGSPQTLDVYTRVKKMKGDKSKSIIYVAAGDPKNHINFAENAPVAKAVTELLHKFEKTAKYPAAKK